MEPMRYDLHCCDGDSGRCRAEMEESEDGDYMSYESYAAQVAEIERLTGEIKKLTITEPSGFMVSIAQHRAVVGGLRSEIKRLKARVAELEAELNSQLGRSE